MKTYKFKLYNSKRNKKLHRQINIAGSIYNHCIALHRRYYRIFKKSLPAFSLSKHLTKLKRLPRYSYWKLVGSQAIQDISERISRAYALFFRNLKHNIKTAPPCFKKIRKYKSFTFTSSNVAAAKAGFAVASVFAITMYCVQGFAGYPLTAICLQFEGKRLLQKYRSGEVQLTPDQIKEMQGIGLTAIADDSHVKKLLPKMPSAFNTPVFMLAKLGFVAWIATLLGQVTPVNGAIWALVLGIIATYIGFLESNTLSRANSYWIIMFALMMFVFDGLKDCTPDMLVSIIVPMVVLIIIGVIGMGITSFIIAKILRMSFFLAFANGLTALYGFPCDAIITEMTCNSLTKDKTERSYLMAHMFPSMIVGGFVTVTITSVLIAGYFATLF